jgi:SAM-dependent methyltransferase
MNNTFEKILEMNRWIRIAYNNLKTSKSYNNKTDLIVQNYLDKYINDSRINIENIPQIYFKFTNQYSNHIRKYIESDLYPFEYEKSIELNRCDYDIILILSIILSEHRHIIFSKLLSYSEKNNGNILLIGIGSGIELEFLDLNTINTTIYDLEISPLLKSYFSNINFKEYRFTGQEKNIDIIYAIELLEHLDDPYEFLENAKKSLKNGGEICCTTVTNVPQFDHLQKFKGDEFEKKIKTIGLRIKEKQIIKHNSIDKKLDAYNTWYILKK